MALWDPNLLLMIIEKAATGIDQPQAQELLKCLSLSCTHLAASIELVAEVLVHTYMQQVETSIDALVFDTTEPDERLSLRRLIAIRREAHGVIASWRSILQYQMPVLPLKFVLLHPFTGLYADDLHIFMQHGVATMIKQAEITIRESQEWNFDDSEASRSTLSVLDYLGLAEHPGVILRHCGPDMFAVCPMCQGFNRCSKKVYRSSPCTWQWGCDGGWDSVTPEQAEALTLVSSERRFKHHYASLAMFPWMETDETATMALSRLETINHPATETVRANAAALYSVPPRKTYTRTADAVKAKRMTKGQMQSRFASAFQCQCTCWRQYVSEAQLLDEVQIPTPEPELDWDYDPDDDEARTGGLFEEDY